MIARGDVIMSLILVSRKMEDFVTWVDSSKIKHHIMKYNDKVCYALMSSMYTLMYVCSLTTLIFSDLNCLWIQLVGASVSRVFSLHVYLYLILQFNTQLYLFVILSHLSFARPATLLNSFTDA